MVVSIMKIRVLGNDKDFVIMDKDLLRGLSEKEVEIEHLKTTVIALNQKVEVFISLLKIQQGFTYLIQIIKDMEKDVGNAKTNLNVSETKRVELQEHIKTTTI